MISLFEMTETARQLYSLLEAGEIDEQTVNDTMESLGASEKLESLVYVQKSLEGDIDSCIAQIERLEKRRKSLENHVLRLKNAQIAYMQATGQKSANAGTFKVRLIESKSCDVTDETAVPAQYIVEIPASTRLDKKAMLAALKEGKEIAGARLKINYSVSAK